MARAAFVIDRVMGRIGLEGRSLRVAALLLRLRGAGHHGDAHDPVAAQPARHDPGRAAHDLLGAAARLRAADRRLRAGDGACSARSGSRAWCCSPLPARRARGARRRGGAQARRCCAAKALPFYMELPPYRMPTLAPAGATQVWGSARAFLRRAGTIILGVSIVLWVLLNVPARRGAGRRVRRRGRGATRSSTASPGRIGHALEPLIAPLGFDWKIGVGLVASLAAREVIVSTLAQIYAASDEDSLAARGDPRATSIPARAARSSRRPRWPRCSSSSSSRSSACRPSR